MFYSATNNTWYLPGSRSKYEAAGGWPDDAAEYPMEVFLATVANRPAGKELAPDADGRPTLVSPEGPTRAECEAHAWEKIKAERDRRTQLGGFEVEGHWFHSDTFSRSQQLGLVMMGAAVPAVQWKTMAGDFVTMTPELASAIFHAGAASDMAVFAAAEEHRTAMLQSADPLAYDFTGNWPQAYGEEA